MVREAHAADFEIAVDSVKQGHRFRDCPIPAMYVVLGSYICIICEFSLGI